MPFWWRRRAKPWMGYRYKRRRFIKKRRRRRIYKRRRPARNYYRRRRRHRRKHKVRRKRKFIPIKQWQPDSIVKCKIKGLTVLVLGADGRQNRCYTDNKLETVLPKTPSGGGFGYEKYNLKYLYSEYKAHNNIWTATNTYKDLCRYTGSKFTVYRHPEQDFIIQYDIQPPFEVTKLTYMQAHPYLMLLQKNHKVILSKKTNPNGRLTKTIKIKPTKEMTNNWFFQKNFAEHTLLTIKAAACSFTNSYIQCCNENQQLSIYYLDIKFYQHGNWGLSSYAYNPYSTAPPKKTYYCTNIKGEKYTVSIDASTYAKSVSYKEGWFTPKLLQAIHFWNQDYTTIAQDAVPINYAIYNPNLDDGEGNKIYLHSLTTDTYIVPKDDNIVIRNVPLWLGLYGFLDWIKKKYNLAYFTTHCIILESKALLLGTQATATKQVIPLDRTFIQGNQYFNQPPTTLQKVNWFPTIDMQLATINDIVETGPFIPKLGTTTRESTWELKSRYTFYFKWGGPKTFDPAISNPENQGVYPTTSANQETIQICNPEKQKTETIFHEWDIRRGCIKEAAFKRMYDNLSSSTDGSNSPTQSPQKKRQRLLPCLEAQDPKKKEIQTCLHSLFEESTCQETQDIQQLINQQQQQQRDIKHNIYKLLLDLKQQQNLLQLHTGLLN
nr:MAG: ORF1 [Torque teno midi virus]